MYYYSVGYGVALPPPWMVYNTLLIASYGYLNGP